MIGRSLQERRFAPYCQHQGHPNPALLRGVELLVGRKGAVNLERRVQVFGCRVGFCIPSHVGVAKIRGAEKVSEVKRLAPRHEFFVEVRHLLKIDVPDEETGCYFLL